MARLTATVSDEEMELIEELSSEGGPYASKSEAVRECIRSYERVDELECENERLGREKRAVIDQREEHGELVEYVEGERELQRLERERRNAPVWKRIEWFVFGRE